MSDPGNPYSPSTHSIVALPRIRPWLSNFAASVPSALAAIVWLFRVAERRHFAVTYNDPALLRVALPQLICVALVAGLACSLSRRPRPLRAFAAALVVGPMVATLAYVLYTLAHRLA